MPKDLPAAIITQLNAQQKRPALLFKIVGSATTFRFTANKTDIIFPAGGNTYTAKAVILSNLKHSLEGQIGRATVKFGNVSRDMAAYANIENFNGLPLTIKRIYLDALGDVSYYNEYFNGRIESVTGIDRNWLTISAITGKSLNLKVLNSAYQRMCPWIFGGTECNTDGNANLSSLTASGTADSGTTFTLVDNALTQPENRWKYGNIEITKSGIIYHRKVKSFDATTDTVTLDVEVPFAIDNTCTYTVYKGCDQTWLTCTGINNWGPSADNKENFNGCVHISKIKDASI